MWHRPAIRVEPESAWPAVGLALGAIPTRPEFWRRVEAGVPGLLGFIYGTALGPAPNRVEAQVCLESIIEAAGSWFWVGTRSLQHFASCLAPSLAGIGGKSEQERRALLGLARALVFNGSSGAVGEPVVWTSPVPPVPATKLPAA